MTYFRRVTHWPCRYCGTPIFFVEGVVGSNGRMVPCEYHPNNPKLDGRTHLCKSPKNPRVHRGAMV